MPDEPLFLSLSSLYFFDVYYLSERKILSCFLLAIFPSRTQLLADYSINNVGKKITFVNKITLIQACEKWNSLIGF